MNDRQLKSLLKAVECGSFSKAEEARTQPRPAEHHQHLPKKGRHLQRFERHLRQPYCLLKSCS
ncbi:LysR family transcriptional regulator [Paenibacillus thalictri]|uniref:LysR family transcriptional regulator n=1 Tax=Paenibacillus thalictri TaxID=2527873 RepID=A0A4V2J3Y9_9BACL|nr:LysR family transcriptional regulator [Paenibacillus thalictri]TBL76320.1 LysR family transcriptional regulator [Paenibacillus thalictri]